MYHDIQGSIKQTAGQTVDYKCQQTIQPSSWPSFKATPKTQTVMTRLALHLFAPSIGSSFDIFLSDSFTKSPLHSQVTWSSSVWKRGGKVLVKLSRTRTTKKRASGCVKVSFQDLRMNKLRDLPLAWGLHECVLPGSGCWDQVGAARVARTPCKLAELETRI